MTTKAYVELDRELEQYLRSLLGGLGRLERVEALGWYTAGLLLAGERKSIAPIAARLSPDPEAAEAIRQRLQQAGGGKVGPGGAVEADEPAPALGAG